MKAFVHVLVTLSLSFGMGCATDSGGGGGGGGGQPGPAPKIGSCFYSCNTSFGTAYGCKSSTSMTTSGQCDTEAENDCGGTTAVGDRAWLDTCDQCDPSCAPAWYKH